MNYIAHMGVDHSSKLEALLHISFTSAVFVLCTAILAFVAVFFIRRSIKTQEVKVPIKKKEQ